MMQSLRSRRRHALPVNAEINITNLVDVAFVLLIIFMITAPIMQGGIELELPKADSAPLTSSEAVVVSVSQDARIFIDQTEVTSLEEFERVFPAYMGTRDGQPVTVQSDARVTWGPVAQVLGSLMAMGYTQVNLLTEPRPGPRTVR